MKKKKITSNQKEKIYNSGYSEGAASHVKPSLKAWNPRSYSAKSDLEMNLKTLRDRAKDLATNSSVGAAIIQTLTTGVLGNGLKLFPTPKFEILGLTAESAREWSKKAQLEFELFAQNLYCDFYRRNNFYEIQRIALESSLADGDSFCIFRRNFSRGSPYSLRLQLIEAQRVSNPADKGAGVSTVEILLPNGNTIVNGVEVDKSGRLIAIHVSNKIWDEPTTTAELTWQRVKVFGENYRNVLHICKDTRPEMYRGAPLLSPVVETLKQVSRFSEAELSSAIIKSFFSLFFTQENTNFDLNQILPSDELDLTQYKLGAGTLNALPRGVKVDSVETKNAQSTFDVFFNNFVKQIGAAVGLPFEVLLKNFQSSYSASRAALLQAEETFKERRAGFIQDFCQPVYENFLAEGIALGRIDAPGFFEDPLKRFAWSNADWRRAIMPSIDPLKSANAAKVLIETGISSREIEATKLGNAFEVVRADLESERQFFSEINFEEIEDETDDAEN